MSARYLSVTEVARRLGVSERTLWRRIAGGSLPVFRDGRIVRVAEGELARYVRERTAEATQAPYTGCSVGMRVRGGTRRPPRSAEGSPAPPRGRVRRLWEGDGGG